MAQRLARLNKEEIKKRFGDCKYSCELTAEPSWWHTIVMDGYTIFVEEWMFDDEDTDIIAVVYKNKKRLSGLSNTEMPQLLDDIEKLIKNNL